MPAKGPEQTGTRTTTSIDPRAQGQAPILADLWGKALQAYNESPQTPYPGQTLANFDPRQQQGLDTLGQVGQYAGSNLVPSAMQPFQAGTSGGYGVQNSPAYSNLVPLGTGASADQQAARAAAMQEGGYGASAAGLGQNYANLLTQQAGQIPGYTDPARAQLGFNAATANAANPALGLLGQQASGAYLNSNPYLDRMYGNAADAVTRAYQTGTSPRTDSPFENAGRYGSPSLRNATTQNELNLGQSLGGLASNIYGQNYAAERGLQNAATQALGSQYLQGVGQSTSAAQAGGALGLDTARAQQAGLSAGGALGLTGLQRAIDATQGGGALNLANAATQQAALNALQGGFQGGNAQAMTAAGLAPMLLNTGITGANAIGQAGTGTQALAQQTIDDLVKRYAAQQAAPWSNLANYSQLIGQPIGKMDTSTQPIYGSSLGQTIGTLGAGSNLLFGNQSGGLLGALGGLGGAGTAGSVLSGIGSGALPAVIAPEIGAAGLSALGAMNAGIPAIAAAAAPAAWIICTELTRQGRMPKRHWAAGLPVFAAYPERTKQGYYYWAIPTVRHLRKYPNSRFSKFIGAISRWRAENIAAHQGVRGARKLWRGAVVSAIGYPICAMLGHFVSVQDWQKETA